MNLAYFRTSKYPVEETAGNVAREAGVLGLQVLGKTELPGEKGIMLHVCNPVWANNLIASDPNLIGLLPCSVAVIYKGSKVQVGVGSPAILGGVSQNPAVNKIASDADAVLKELIHKSAGVGPLKPSKITLYSTMACPYCKMEASWLKEKKVSFEEIHVDLNQKAAEEMVQKTGQMGVPVTGIVYDDGTQEFIIGFDKAHLSQIFGVLS